MPSALFKPIAMNALHTVHAIERAYDSMRVEDIKRGALHNAGTALKIGDSAERSRVAPQWNVPVLDGRLSMVRFPLIRKNRNSVFT